MGADGVLLGWDVRSSLLILSAGILAKFLARRTVPAQNSTAVGKLARYESIARLHEITKPA